ncbi:D-alanyl-D-alanine carboxypeptidase family protein [Pseudooceanicola aestuarii]|uniref:D-alanyl-D-alanine carboxypeptidase family protein n=1 Tax=Pseudooceanicola aestuarii TaxID=2697319 RepID=UPI0013D5B7FF|nr:D-alanyl-D-alanine carboxypeptidase family protein [Pseudooceanicola aestuarii]
MLSTLRQAAAATIAILLCAAQVQAFDTRARTAFVMDLGTRTVLLDKNADQPVPPASMSKLMTLYVAFEAIRDGRLSLNEELPVSSHAMSYGGSTMFLDTTDRVRVEDLLRGIIVLSGNDACAVIAEALSPDGTEAGFARYMTQRAQQMGMTGSTFTNSNGWPQAGHRMTMRDLALLARHLIEDFPNFYPMFAEQEFEFDGRAPQNIRNRNPLLGLGIGADGLKTGHTEEAGYGLVGSAKQGNRRIVFAFAGLSSTKERAEEAQALVNWAFRQFAEREIMRQGDVVTRAPVWMGSQGDVGLAASENVIALLPILSGKEVEAEIVFDGPIHAPISKGQELGTLILTPTDLPETRVQLVADTDVARGGFATRIKAAALHLVRRLNEGPEGAS